jgi:hypothetical protein
MTPNPLDQTAFHLYRAEVLFLLVGGNPLPNYVSAQLMAKPDADIHLLATPGTSGIAGRLKTKLQQVMDKAHIHHHTIPEVGGFEIENALMKILEKEKESIRGRRIGLNYTGGTKDMAVHVYDRIQDEYPKGVFSYLDAGTRNMGIYVEARRTQWPSAARAIVPSLKDLWELHGLQPKQSRKRPFVQRKQPRLPDLCRAIAKVHSTSKGFQQWRDWLRTLVGPNGAPPSFDQYPDLEAFIDEIELVCGGPPDAKTLAKYIDERFENLSSCRSFLISEWLEEYALNALLVCQKEIGFQDWAIGLNLQPPPPDDPAERQAPDFELDVVALAGYQLFLLSCIATEAGDPEPDEDDTVTPPEQEQPKKKKGAGNRGEAKEASLRGVYSGTAGRRRRSEGHPDFLHFRS